MNAKKIVIIGAVCTILSIGIIIHGIKKAKPSPVDILITQGTVITMDPQKKIIPNGAIAIKHDTIVAIGTSKDIAGQYAGKKVINAHDRVVLPGLINAHTHAAMTLFRGLADDLSLMSWLQKYIIPAEKKNVTEEFVYWGTILGCYEMIKGGTTTFVDMYFFEDSVAQAAYEMSMRAIVGETITDFSTPDSKTYKQALDYTRNFVKKWKHNKLITPAIAPHAPYSCSKETLLAVQKFSQMHNIPLLTHLAETKDEVQQIITKHNKRPVAYLDSLGLLNEKLIAAHCIYLNDAEITLLKQKNVGVVHAPTSNMKLGSGIARIYEFLKLGVFVGLGTDGAASNNSLDMFAEIKTAALLQKVGREDPTALRAYQALELATISGARAVHMENKIGSLEVGKKADIIVVAIDNIHQIPVYNVISQLVYATKATDVQTVIINGKIIMEDKVLGTQEQEEELRGKIEYFRSLIAKEK